jgi:hypothetical protein
MPSRPSNFSLGTESEAAMLADLYNPDVFFCYQSMGMDQLVGAAADIVNVLMVFCVVAISLTFVTPDMSPGA